MTSEGTGGGSAVAEAPAPGARASAPEPTTLPALLLGWAERTPERTALRHKERGLWQEISWEEYARRSAHAGLGLLELGVEPGDRVSIHSENRPAWVFADLGVQGAGAISVGIYPTSPAAEVSYLLGHSESKVLIAEDEEQLDKALEVRDELPALEHIVIIDPHGVQGLGEDPMLLTFEQLEEMGARRAGADGAWGEYTARVTDLDASETAIIVYTSGTTGPPKGAMLTHRNLLAVAESGQQVYDVGPDDEVLSYLPLCHIAERLFSVIDALEAGYVVNFGEGTDTFQEDLRDIQPTFFLGVPRVWEKVMAGVEIRISDADPLKRLVYRLAKRWGQAVARRELEGRSRPYDRLVRGLTWLLCFRSLRHKLGLSRVRVALSGAAPIAREVLEWLWAIGVPVREGYGQTENTAMCSYTPDDGVKLGTVGVALPGVELKIAPDGEILTRSPGVFAGYFRNPEATRETVDSEGWLYTGDIGEIDEDGYLKITDRKKDVIITAGGKNISPSEIENLLKVSPYVREAVIVGDERKYLSALIGIESDTVGDWAQRQGVGYTTYRDLSERPEVRELIQGVVEEANSQLARVEEVKRFELIPIELDHEEGQLTATQKVKRQAIAEQFGDLIEGMYGG